MQKDEAPIMIIEDDADDRDVMESICNEIGICDALKFFTNGKDALQYLKSTPRKPFMILCDINMPQLDGLQLRDELNKNESLRKKSIPFIFFSTAASEAQIRKAYDMTVQGFFIKENTFSETVETLNIILKYWRKCKHPENGIRG